MFETDQNTTTFACLGLVFFTGTCTSSWSALMLLDSQPTVTEFATRGHEDNVNAWTPRSQSNSAQRSEEEEKEEEELTGRLVLRTIPLEMFH